MKSQPFDKIQLIELSLRCFTCGLIGLLPGIGLPFAIIALTDALRVAWHKGSLWNPAEFCLTIGTLCAILGISATTLLGGAIYIESYWKG